MKPLAIILVLLCVVAVGAMAYLYFDASVSVLETGRVAADAAGSAEFSAIREALSADAFPGTVFISGDLGPEEDYQFQTYTVRLQNRTFLPAEVVELQICPMDGDVLQVSSLSRWEPVRQDLSAHSWKDFSVTLLTRKDLPGVRELIITWYQWGRPFEMKITCQ